MEKVRCGMDRRTFIKVGAAVSTLFAIPEQIIKSPIRWDLFTEPDAARYSLGLPFQQGDYGYATNGYLALRTSAKEDLFVGADAGRFPNMKECWDRYFQDSDCWKELALKPGKHEGLGRCHECFGKGHFGNAKECEKCHGDQLIWKGDDLINCDACQGVGIVGDLCKSCKGHPWDRGGVVELNDGRLIDAANVARILTLGSVQYRELRNPGRGECVEFRFERGRGLVMPMIGK